MWVKKGYWAQTDCVVHVGVGEVAIRMHIEHVSIATAIPVIRRHVTIMQINQINYIIISAFSKYYCKIKNRNGYIF